MYLKHMIEKLKNKFSNKEGRHKTLSLNNKSHKEKVNLNLAGLNIKLYRHSHIDTPNEITIVVPRVEIRQKCLNDDCSQFENEIIFNSVTVVSAPRHPLADPESNVDSSKKEDKNIKQKP